MTSILFSEIYARKYNVPLRREHNGIGHNTVLPLNPPAEENVKRPENSQELDPDYKDFEQQSTKGKTSLQNGCIRLDQPVYNILEELHTPGEPMTLNNCDNRAVKQVLQRLHPENATENCNGGCSTSKGHSPVKDPKEPMSDGTEREYKVLEGPIAEGDTFHHGANSSKGPLYYTQEEPRQNDPQGEQDINDQGDRVYHVLEENTYLNTFQFPNGTF